MKSKVRPGHKYLPGANKFSKAYSEKKNGTTLGRGSLSADWWVMFENILYRVAKQDLDHFGREASIIKETKKV